MIGRSIDRRVLFESVSVGHYSLLIRSTPPQPQTEHHQGKPLPLEGTTDAFGRGHLFSRIIELPPGRHQVGCHLGSYNL